MMEEKSTQEKTNTQNSRKESFILTLIFIFLVSLVFVAGYWAWQKLKPAQVKNTPSIEKLAGDAPREEIRVEEKKSTSSRDEEEKGKLEEKILPADINVKVLNGGAVSGAAVKVKNTLVAEGYSKTEADNATTHGYKGVTIYYAEKFENEAQKIEEILKKNYQSLEKKKGMDEKEVGGDIVIILGS